MAYYQPYWRAPKKVSFITANHLRYAVATDRRIGLLYEHYPNRRSCRSGRIVGSNPQEPIVAMSYMCPVCPLTVHKPWRLGLSGIAVFIATTGLGRNRSVFSSGDYPLKCI